MSEALTQRIAAMKTRADMMREVEGVLGRVCECVREFGDEVEKPLPPPPLLGASRDEILERQVSGEGVKVFCQYRVKFMLVIQKLV